MSRGESQADLAQRVALWAACALFTAALGAAVLLRGGVYPQQWAWCALGITVAGMLVDEGRIGAVGAFAVRGGHLTELPGSPTGLPAGATPAGIVVD